MSTPNPHETAAREAKAQRLAHHAVEALINTAEYHEDPDTHAESITPLLDAAEGGAK